MKSKRYIIGLWFLVAVMVTAIWTSCRPRTIYVYRGFPEEYTSGWENQYGTCYDSIPYAVVAVDLYSEGLELNEQHRIKGTGYNLFISDIFVSSDTTSGESQLAAGTYRSDTSALPYTFLPGKDYEGYPYGVYLLQIEEDQVVGIQVIDSGYMVVKDTIDGQKDLSFTLYYKNGYGYASTYTTHFQGILTPWKKQ